MLVLLSVEERTEAGQKNLEARRMPKQQKDFFLSQLKGSLTGSSMASMADVELMGSDAFSLSLSLLKTFRLHS